MSKDPSELHRLFDAWKGAVESGAAENADIITSEFIVALESVAAELIDRGDPETLLEIEIARHEQYGNWAAVEALYRKQLEMAAQSGNAIKECSARGSLARFYDLLDKFDESYQLARDATMAARRADLKRWVQLAAIGTMLNQEASAALALGRLSEAKAAMDEAVEIDNCGRIDLLRAHSFILRANCLVRLGAYADTESDLQEAWQLLEPKSGMQLAAGVQERLADWWTVYAQLKAEIGDWLAAAESWARAIERRRQVAEAPQCIGVYTMNSLARSLWSFGQALATVGRGSEGEEHIAESNTIRTAIHLPPFRA